jgi:amidase
MVPLAHGNDGGGSTRIPAACCGLVGLKSARGRVSVGPDNGQSFLVADGVLTHTVAETAELLDLMAGYELGDANWAPPLADGDTYVALSAGDPGRLRVGLAFNPPLDGATVDPIHEQAARDTAALLESLGHEVTEITPPWSGLDLLPDFSRAFGPGIAFTVFVGGRIAGRDPTPEDVEPLTWEMWERALDQDTIKYMAAQARLESVARSVITFLEPYDAVITPALGQRQLRIGEVHGRGPDHWDHFQRSGMFTPYTAIVNVTGQPAIMVPLYHGDDGLPTGVQLIGRPAGEAGLLRLATQLERALPWSGRQPDLAPAVD